MNQMKSQNYVKVYEFQGEELGYGKDFEIGVENHWNIDDFVVLEVDMKKYTVLASELRKAIENATNTKII